MKNSIKTLFAILCFSAIAATLHAQTIDFSGQWKRNNEQSVAGGLSINSVPTELKVAQEKNSINIQRTSVNGKGESFTYSEKIKLDGTPATNVVVKANLKKTANAKWSEDKNSLLIDADYFDDQGNKVQHIKEMWTLANDSKTLTIQRTDMADGQLFELKEVFDK